jgi:glycerol-3-phosphate dehydrogenase
MKSTIKTQVLIIGGGATGTGIARDLALRGVHSLLVERGDINAGASGANHGLLHSGGRYVFNDPETAKECRIESDILKRTASHCIEDAGGLFVAVEGDDETHIRDFPDVCAQCGIVTRELSPSEARDMEPSLSQKVIAAYAVKDASIDPFRLSLDNIYQAITLGSTLMCHSQIVDFKLNHDRIRHVIVKDRVSGDLIEVEADQVVNASGAWAGEVAALAGVSIDMAYSKGSLLITNHRITDRVINRLRPPADGDILVPGGTVSLVGTTSIRIKTLEDIRPTIAEIDAIIDQSAAMLPILDDTRFIRAYSGVRPLVGSQSTGSDRSISRGFALLDHCRNGLENFVTITGGKLTTYRYMAELTSDLVCEKLGVTALCTTETDPLPPSNSARWTTPGLAPKEWVQQNRPEDIILCECEMVPKSVINSILSDVRKLGIQGNLKVIGLRSRIGKGSCQGAFCSARITAHMYDENDLFSDGGLKNMRTFLNERWKGLRPVLWDLSLVQEELQEAMHCGFFGLEL